MSILTEEFPRSLIISGQECVIETDFKIWLKVSEIISDSELSNKKIARAFRLIFKEPPPNFFDAFNAMVKFYSHDAQASSKNEEKTFDFTHDANMIYSAFMQQYKIDLTDVQMHWWKFKALFGGLSEETHFIKTIQYRTVDISKIKDKEQKKFYQKMKAIHKLPDGRSEIEKEEHINTILEGLF